MERILFIDACLRGPEQSRTYGLCRHFLAEYTARHPSTEVIRRELAAMELPVMTGKLAQEREGWLKGEPEHPLLQPAKDMAGADLILVGAPYWEYQLPALLRCYLEQISVGGLTFVYGEDGRPHGLCKPNKLFYITTAGGPILDRNCGFDYIKTLCGNMLGFTDIDYVAAECLDVWGVNVEEKIREAEEVLRSKIKSWH